MEQNYLNIIKENCTAEQFNTLMVTMESDKSKLSIVQETLKQVFQRIMGKLQVMITGEKGKEFEAIAKSNGDITKVKNFDTTMKVLDILAKDKRPDIKNRVNNIKTLVSELKKRKTQWIKIQAIARKSDSAIDVMVAKLFYWSYCAGIRAVIAGTSLTAAKAMNVIPTNSNDKIYEEITQVNALFKNGNFDKCINYLLDDKATESVALLVTVVAVVTVITVALSLRIFVYYFYYTRVKIADYFAQQSDFLTIHENEVKKNGSISSSEKNSIVDAQKVWAKRFMDLSELFMVDDLKVEKEVTKEIKSANKEIVPTSIIKTPNTGMDFF